MSRSPIERWLRPREVLLGRDGVWDFGDEGPCTHPDFEDWCGAHPGWRCRLFVSSTLLIELPVDHAMARLTDGELLAWSRAQLLGYHGDAAATWDGAAWRAGRARGVSVLHGTSVAALRGTAEARGVRLVALQPWWSALLPAALRRDPHLRRGQARLHVIEQTRLTTVSLLAGRVQGVELSFLDESTTGAVAARLSELPAAHDFVVGYGLEGSGAAVGRVPPALRAVRPMPHGVQGVA